MGNRLGNTWKLEEHMGGIIGNLVGTPESKKDLKNNKQSQQTLWVSVHCDAHHSVHGLYVNTCPLRTRKLT